MTDVRLGFEERKQIIKWYWKFENVVAVRRKCRRRSGRPRTATSDESTSAVLELFKRSPLKSSSQASRESDVSASSVLRILGKASFVCTFQGWCNSLSLSGHFGTMYGISVGSC
ncbi:solute carrier organic anion transporter family member 2B1 X3 [Biomphalaria glabrata]|nr:solute carrier organic anion transporter family member 2B1 X3 [Biomphalaria glabrata]